MVLFYFCVSFIVYGGIICGRGVEIVLMSDFMVLVSFILKLVVEVEVEVLVIY